MAECFFCKECDNKTVVEDVEEFLGLPMCPYHRKCAAKGFEAGMETYGFSRYKADGVFKQKQD